MYKKINLPSFLLFFLILSSNSYAEEYKNEKLHVDIIMEADHILTMNSSNTILKNSAIAIDGGLILDIDNIKNINAKYQTDNRISGKHKIALPGLINGHSHAAMTLLRGIADDRSLIDWLNNYIFPLEQQFVNADFVRIGTELACWEMIRGGTTTFVDMYFYPDVISKVVTKCGLRGLISSTISDNQTPNAQNAEDAINGGEEYINRWAQKTPTITPILGPHAIYSLNLAQLKETRRIAALTDTPISIHLSESEYELQYSKQTYGMTSIEALDSIDFFNGRTIAAHVVWPTKKEIAILAERNVGVIHNPTSNMKLASGIAPIADMLDAGILIGLGTDGAASNNDLDMWEEMRLAALLQKVTQMNPEVLPATTVLRMATTNGANIIGLGEKIGKLEIGMDADIIQVAFDDVHHQPNYDIPSHLVYVTDEQDVVTVIVNGKLLMHEGQFFTLDTKKISEEVAAMATKIANSIK
ncbi:MAG: amidohydrolase family protein [Woeseiaceae bacterium]|nr:amidohydrolase [Woeseiaceae bacterium]